MLGRFFALAAVAVLTCATARADTLTVAPDNATPASGSYQISVNPSGPATFTIGVLGNSDGYKDDPDGSGPLEAKRPAQSIGLLFSHVNGSSVPVVEATGSTTAGADPSGSFSGGEWTFLSEQFRGSAVGTGARLGAFGGNSFTGTVRLANGAFDHVDVFIVGGSQMWSGSMAVPEPSLAGIALTGLLALRRRGRRNGRAA